MLAARKHARMHVVVAGGGVGALEGVLALQELAAAPLEISLLTPGRYLTYRALSVAEPFGGAAAPHFEWDAITRDRGVRWIQDAVAGVRPDERRIETRDGTPVTYDALLLALGATPLPALRGALMFAGPRDVLAVREVLEEIEPGRAHRIAFVAVAGTAWTLPLYELALMTAEYGRRKGLDLALEVVTAEDDAARPRSGPRRAPRWRSGWRTRASGCAPGRMPPSSARAGSGSSRRARSTSTSPSRCRT